MSAQEYLAGVCRYTSLALVRAASHVPEDKRDWSPMGAARPVWEQLLECAYALESAKKWIESGEFAFGNYEAVREEAKLAPPSLEIVAERLKTAADAYAQTLESLSDEQAQQPISDPRTGRSNPLIRSAGMPVMNLVYHYGQINYIQMLLGDTENH